MRDLVPVVFETGLKEALRNGGIVEILCVAEAEKNFNIYQGAWKIRVHIGDQTAYLATSRSTAPREFKTVTGLISFALDLGFSIVSIPLRQGECVVWSNGSERSSPR